MSEAHLIVRHPNDLAVLLVDGALPVVPTSDVLSAGEILGLPLVVVRTQHRDGTNRIVACDLSAESRMPSGSRWAGEATARDVPRYAEAVAGWFDEESGRVSVERPAWLRHGWVAATLHWLDDVLPDRGPRSVRQLRHWGLSGVLRTGDVVVKQTLPMFAGEPDVMRWIEAIDPDAVPRVIHRDESCDRWVMEAFDEQEADREPGALLTLAALQRRAAPHIETLDRPSRLVEPSDVAVLVRRDDILFAGERHLQPTDGRLPPRQFTEQDRDALLAALPEITARVDRLRALRIPHTIVHGDFHVHNVAWTGHRYVLFDWANAYRGHPIMDLPMWLQWAQDAPRSIAAYLGAWGVADPVATWRDVAPVALLSHAMTLLPLVEGEGAGEWAAGVQKRLLEALDAL